VILFFLQLSYNRGLQDEFNIQLSPFWWTTSFNGVF